MNDRTEAQHRLDHGAEFPYDAPDAWWEMAEPKPLPATDWAHAAARGILADLTDRRGIKWSLQEIDEDVRAELVASLAEIIRAALAQAEPVQFDPAEAMRLADKYADLAADVQFAQGFPDRAFVHKRKLMGEARASLAAYLSRQAEPVQRKPPRWTEL